MRDQDVTEKALKIALGGEGRGRKEKEREGEKKKGLHFWQEKTKFW